jgi:LytS/YehU family sensor histidine kinase
VEENAIPAMRSEEEQQQDDAVCNIVVDRLSHLYGDKQDFQMIQHAAGGRTVQIRIPFREQQAAAPHLVLENFL